MEGIKIGLELHQRLNTKHKLFCHCSTKGNEIKTREIKRKFHAVPSELGQVDPAALFESRKSPLHVYDFYKDTCCLVETDDEPPHEMNKEAIEIGIMICNMFNAEIIDEIQVMRKTVIDGSNTSGFQRTAIIGLNGNLKYQFQSSDNESEKTIGIQTIAIEEESCGIIGEQKGEIERFRLDRLGIPLVEIATTPDIKSGKEARFVAEQIGLMLRATGKMMRGIGTIRQDINISIPGGARVEIKGVQELDLIEKVIDNEISRQKTLLVIIEKIKEIMKNKEKKNEIENMNKNKEQYIKDLTDVFKETKNNFIRKAIENKKRVIGMKFPALKGIFGIELYPDYRYGSEMSDYAKTQGVGGIIHCDEDMKKYAFDNEIKETEILLNIKENDGWILIVGEKKKAEDAIKLVFDRAYLLKVPEETRRADLQGKTHYMRPLPGAARMYPETDVPPIRLDKQMKEIKAPSFKEIEERVSSLLNKEMAQKIIRSEKLNLFLELVNLEIEPTIVAVTLEDTLKSIKREGFNLEMLEEEEITNVLMLYKEEKITKAAIPEIIKEIIKYKVNKGIKELGKEEIQRITIEKRLNRISGEKLKNMIKDEKIKNIQELMIKYRLNVDPKEATILFR
jgi:glutamyl-tRNA(Gln) amidotransferase subunit E